MEWADVKALAYPNVGPKELVTAAYAGKKPFKEDGEGFKDYLIFQSLRQLAEAQEGPGYFVTANRKDFCAIDGALHPDLKTALPENCVLTVFDNLHDFNAKILVPELEALDGIAARIRAGDFEGFDLTDGLTNLFIAELCNKYNPLDETGTPLDEPSVESVGEAHVAELDVSRLDEDQLLIELSGRIELECVGFYPEERSVSDGRTGERGHLRLRSRLERSCGTG